jgi:hypothetical protein
MIPPADVELSDPDPDAGPMDPVFDDTLPSDDPPASLLLLLPPVVPLLLLPPVVPLLSVKLLLKAPSDADPSWSW